MAERGMTEVMAQSNCLGEVFIKVQGSSYGTGYLRNLQGMGEAGYIVVAQGSNKNLRFMLESTKSL